MSRLILEGNLDRNFGEYYPVPYIDKVFIDDPGRTGNFSIQIHYSFLFNMSETTRDISQEGRDMIAQALEKFNFYILLARTPTYSGEQAQIINNIKNAPDIYREYKPFGQTLENAAAVQNPFDALQVLSYNSGMLFDILDSIDNDSDSKIIDIDESKLFKKLNDEQFVSFTTDGENRIVKISNTVKATLDVMTKTFIGYESSGGASDVSLIAFSSLEPLSQLFSKKGRKKLSTRSAASLYFGDIAYERLLVSNGNPRNPTHKVPDQTQVLYFDNNDELYSEIPLQTSNGSFHKAPAGVRAEMIEKFNIIADSYQPEADMQMAAAPRPTPLQESINSVKYALATSNSITILPELAMARATIPERSTGTFAGQLYEDLGLLVNRANAVIERSPQVTKKLVTNAKIIDLRQKENMYDLPSSAVVDEQRVAGSDLLKNFYLDRKIITTKQPSTRLSFADFDIAAGTRFESYVDGLGADEFESYDDDDSLMLQLPNGEVYSLDDPEYEGLLNDNYFAPEEYNVSFGYFLFDYDTAIRKNSYIANIFNVDRVIEFFGMPFIQAYYQPLDVSLSKYAPMPPENRHQQGNPIMTFTTPLSWVDENKTGTQEYSPGGSEPGAHGQIARHGTTFENGAPHQVYPEVIKIDKKRTRENRFSPQQSIVINSYLAQRALHIVNEQLYDNNPISDLTHIYGDNYNKNSINNNYRLMAFEFQNIDQAATLDKYEEKVFDKYAIEINIADGTRQAVLAIMKNFYDNMMMFKNEYLEIARQFCSFNNIENNFNDFFITGINQRYSDDPSRAPWVYAVCMYVRHIEFLTNKYSGGTADQILEAKDLLQRIAPETGTLEQVEAFYNILEETFDDFYGQSSKIGRFLAVDGSELDGNGRKGLFEPIVYNTKYNTTHTSVVRSAFVVDERNEFLSLINDERTRYVDADIEYDRAVFNAELPPKTKEADPRMSGGECKFTQMGCDNEFLADALRGAKKCSGKIVRAGADLKPACYCPEGTFENDEGICSDLGDITIPLITFEIEEPVDEELEAKIDYEANKMKKRSKKSKKNKHDCQYVEKRKMKGMNAKSWYWITPKGTDNKNVEYDTGRYGTPSAISKKKRKIKCLSNGVSTPLGDTDGCVCQQTSGQVYEPRSLSKLKDKIRKSLK